MVQDNIVGDAARYCRGKWNVEKLWQVSRGKCLSETLQGMMGWGDIMGDIMR